MKTVVGEIQRRRSFAARCAALTIICGGGLLAQAPTPYTPLLSDQRWDYYWHETYLSPGIYLAALGNAGGGQFRNDPPEWGQGVEGYSKRAGSAFATFSIQVAVHHAAAAALHYDPRYFRCACKGFGPRLGHAFVWSFLTKNEEGETRFNAPVVAGAYAGGMIPYFWYPARYSPLKDGFRAGNQELGVVVGIAIIKEFSPELKRVFHPRANP